MKKRLLTCFLFIVLLASVGISHADTFWKLHWEPGEYVVEFTLEEETTISGIIKMVNEKSEGTNIRLGADRENDSENAYEQFLSVSPDGTPMEPADGIKYEDIGYYYWAVDIPDDQSISKDEAWKILLKFLIDSFHPGKQIIRSVKETER